MSITTHTSIIIRTAAPIYGKARGHAGDITSGDPRLVIESEAGARTHATFGGGCYADAAMHYRSFVQDAALRMDRKSIAALADTLLSVLLSEERTAVIEGVCGRFHTPRVEIASC